MARGKSQWEFGELFPKEPERRVLSVSELTAEIRRLLERQIGRVWVSGEITNLKFQSSGHTYFTLKDAAAQLGCVLFRGEAGVNRELLQDGRKVTLRGELTVYEPRGQYQLRVLEVELQGIGALQIAFEKLKAKLNAEGLFAPDRKRPLPRFAQRLGLVTSATGAAIRDVLHVIERRNPSLEIVLVPCRVQGAGAATEIAAAITLLNRHHQQCLSRSNPGLDLVLVTRGGGSLEDLWAFNEEIVARAIYHSTVPVVSAVGHEIDFTISDFVADVRAATPSAAAEIITEGVFSSCQFMSEVSERMRFLVGQQIAGKQQAFEHSAHRLSRVHPRRHVNDRLQRLDDLRESLGRCLRQCVRQQRTHLQNLHDRLRRVRPGILLRAKRALLHQEYQRLQEQGRHRVEMLRKRLAHAEAQLRLLGPEQVLARGYSITLDAQTERVLRAPDQVSTGRLLKTRLAHGSITSRVERDAAS